MSKQRSAYETRHRDIARAYRRAVSRGNGLDAAWLSAVMSSARRHA